MPLDLPGSPRPGPTVLAHGIVVQAPSNLADTILVRIPSTANPDPWGPMPWAPRGSELPTLGQECLVAFDERGEPWVIAFST